MKSKEERFRELIGDLYTGDYYVRISINTFPNAYHLYNSKGEWLIDYEQDIGYAWIQQDRIWLIFENEYNMEFKDIQVFMEDMLCKYIKIKEVKAHYLISNLREQYHIN